MIYYDTIELKRSCHEFFLFFFLVFPNVSNAVLQISKSGYKFSLLKLQCKIHVVVWAGLICAYMLWES